MAHNILGAKRRKRMFHQTNKSLALEDLSSTILEVIFDEIHTFMFVICNE